MSVPVVAFFNNKGGVGKTSLTYHLSWMCRDLGLRVLAADLDPQANLSAAFLEDERLETLWGATPGKTIETCLAPLSRGTGDVISPAPEEIEEPLALLVGDIELSRFEDMLSDAWPRCLDKHERSFRVMSAFSRVIQRGANSYDADVVLMDLGPNLGAINRAALIAADYVAVPLSPDLFSLRGLSNLGPVLREWRSGWTDRMNRFQPGGDLPLPAGRMEPIGYIVLQHSVRLDRPTKAYDRWIRAIPQTYGRDVLGDPTAESVPLANDPNCLALIRHYRSLAPLAQEARKPIFHLKPADGAIGAHQQAVEGARQHFEALARRILGRIGVSVPNDTTC